MPQKLIVSLLAAPVKTAAEGLLEGSIGTVVVADGLNVAVVEEEG